MLHTDILGGVMAKGDAGGAAMSGGADYQARVASYFIVQLLLKREINKFLPINENSIIKSIHFEAAVFVDDLYITTESRDLFFQIKRSINLSDESTSEFYKTIKQFFYQFIINPDLDNYYILVTSSDASSKIRKSLKKYIDSTLLNETDFDTDPWNESEQKAIATLKSVVEEIFYEKLGDSYHQSLFLNFLKKLRFLTLDIEKDGSAEKEIMSLLMNQTKLDEKHLWNDLVAFSLNMAKERKSINYEGLIARFKNYLVQRKEVNDENFNEDFFKKEIQNRLISGKEVFLVKSPSDEDELWIMDSKRFDDGGERRWTISHNKCTNSVGATYDLILRASSLDRVGKYMHENKDFFATKKVIIFESRIDYEAYELTHFPYSHTLLCKKIIDQKKRFNICMACDLAIGDNSGYLVEFDDSDQGHDVGLVHKKCNEGQNRILGEAAVEFFQHHHPMDNFDIELWNRLYQKSALRIQEAKENFEENSRLITIGWNSNHNSKTSGEYCIQINLEHNKKVVATERGRVLRFSESAGKKMCSDMQENLIKRPMYFLMPTRAFGTKQELIHIKKPDEEILGIVSHEIIKCTKIILDKYESKYSFYAPLFYLENKETAKILEFNNQIALFTEPENFIIYIENYIETYGINLNDFRPVIIKSDEEFDLLGLRKGTATPFIIDALFSIENESLVLIEGLLVKDIEKLKIDDDS